MTLPLQLHHLATPLAIILLLVPSQSPASCTWTLGSVVGALPDVDPSSSLVGTWLGYDDKRPQPQMKVTFSAAGWMTKAYLLDPSTSFRCRYRLTSKDVFAPKCMARGMRVTWLDANTIEFKATDGKSREESIEIIYTLTFRRSFPVTQPN